MDLYTIKRRLDDLRRQTSQHQPTDRLDFEINGRIVGSVSASDAQLLASKVAGVARDADTLSILPVCAPDAPGVLQQMASVLREAGRAGRWRNEAMPVTADDGTVMGSIERACLRVLGIRSFAVHLIGQVAAGPGPRQSQAFWLQRRAPDKDIDPNRLDTLAGGLVGMNQAGTATESFDLALSRETVEEAGLQPSQYDKPRRVGAWRVQREVEGGFMIEDLIVARASLKPGVIPVNQDGEVAEFLCVDRKALTGHLDANELTLEASIATLMCLADIEEQQTAG